MRKPFLEVVYEKQEKVRQLRRALEKEEAELRELKQELLKRLKEKGITQFPVYVGHYKVVVSEYEVESVPSKSLKELKKYEELWKVLRNYVKINKITKVQLTKIEEK